MGQPISKDAFEPEETATHSSSVVDLIESCKAPVEFILGLEWPDEFGHAKFLTGLSRVRLSHALIAPCDLELK